MKDPYVILGVSPNADDDEIKAAYRELVRKYHPDSYGDDNPLKDLATEKMQEINEAYDEICRIRARKKNGAADGNASSGAQGGYVHLRMLINSRKFAEAERELFAIPMNERNAEWHYLASVLLMHRNRPNDAMRELEIACSLYPSNMEYQKAKEMFNNVAQNYGSTYYGSTRRAPQRTAGSVDVCDCCANLLCMDCLCECLGGDLIPCL